MSKQQKEELQHAWQKPASNLDYVTGWHAKSLEFFKDRSGEFAYVTTNSICQGAQVPGLFGPIFEAGWRIRFAHRTFVWDSEAPGKAAVHCVIVGFTKDHSLPQQVWSYDDARGKGVKTTPEIGLNAYLVDGPDVLVKSRSTPLSDELSPAGFGSMPNDGGNLIVESNEYSVVAADPVAAKYLRPFRMGRELVRGLDRWCLWMAGDDFEPSDVARSPVLQNRLSAVRKARKLSKRAATRERAQTPHLFGERRQPTETYLAIPAVVSSSRRYYTAQLCPPEVIAGNKIFTVDDRDGTQFALISSSMFVTWQKAIGGRLKSDLNFSTTLVWNTFPVPSLSEEERKRISSAGHSIIAARKACVGSSLADQYNPLAMDQDLMKAHDELDEVVDVAFGAPRMLATERERLEVLFERYVELSSNS